MNGHAEKLGPKGKGSDGYSNGYITSSNGNAVPQLRSEDSVKSKGDMNGYHHMNVPKTRVVMET